MTFLDFNLLPTKLKSLYTISNGIYLASRDCKQMYVKLHWVDYFYVEVFYRIETDELLHVRGFMSTERLEPYLDKIELPL